MLYKRSNSKLYWCRFTAPDGQRVQQSTQTVDKKLVQEYEDWLKSECWRVYKLGDKPRYTWKQAVVQWFRESSHKATSATDKLYLAFADKYLGELCLDQIDRTILEKVIADKLATGVQPATVNRMMEVIRAILNKCVKEWEWIDKAPYVRMLEEPKRRIRWITPDQAEALCKAALPEHLEAMCRFSLATGLRESNVTGLEWSQVDLDRRVAWIHADQSKSGLAMGNPLNNEAVLVLRKQSRQHKRFVFAYFGKSILKANTRAFRNGLTKVEIENFRWHDLRHTWASWHVQNGTPIHVLQELGGWSDIRMVQRYAHLAPEHLSAYAGNISGLRGVSGTLLATPGNQAIVGRK
jgi:integrase